MRFRTHFLGGLLAAGAVITVSQTSGYTAVNPEDFIISLRSPLSISGDVSALLSLFFITLFMSLFPDLDSASVLQRWFYRILLLILVFLFLTGQTGLFAAVAFISLLPLLHKHRGWTHSKITPFFLAIVFAIVVEYNRSRSALIGEFSTVNIVDWYQTYWIYILACVTGHYTHLFLDWRF
jgi:LexA-binding, inner membrane-associated putative hydrolase